MEEEEEERPSRHLQAHRNPYHFGEERFLTYLANKETIMMPRFNVLGIVPTRMA